MEKINIEGASLILEGGTFRTIHTSGILDAYLHQKIIMPYILGISAGAINAVSYISQQPERTMRVFTNYRNDKRYIGKRNFLKEKSLFGLDFSYNVIPNELDLFDWERFYSYEGIVKFGVTNAYTGQVEYMNALEMDKQFTMLRATCAIPVMFPEIKMNDIPYYDGGLSEPVPIHQAIRDGYDKHVIVLTRPKGYRKKIDSQTKWVMKLLSKKYPKLVEVMELRAKHYNDSMELCEQLENDGKALIYRPANELQSFEKDVTQLKRNYQMGYDLAIQRHDELISFLNNR